MNCDQAFDLLTSGADANDAGCEASLDQHLAECAHCARLAEAMGPATDLFLAVNASHDDAYRRQESALKFVSMGTAGIIAPNWSERCSSNGPSRHGAGCRWRPRSWWAWP